MAKSEQEVREKEGCPVDTNNNNNNNDNNSKDGSGKTSGGCGGKYQLRPRGLQPRRLSDCEWNFEDTPLRRKQRPQPLSRYRRKTANARERYRMRQINRAFESLRGVLPAWVCSRRAAADMTKITTLRLASAYIRSLQDILEGDSGEDNAWVLSSILADNGGTQDHEPGQDNLEELAPGDTSQDTDLVTLFCNTGDAAMLQDSLEFSCLAAPMSEAEAVALLLGGPEPPRPWPDLHQPQIVS